MALLFLLYAFGLDEIGLLSQNFKTLESLKLEKIDLSNGSSCKAFFLKKENGN